MKDKRLRIHTNAIANVLPAVYAGLAQNMQNYLYPMPPYGHYVYNVPQMMYPMEPMPPMQLPATGPMANHYSPACTYRYSPYSVPQRTMTPNQHTYSTESRFDYLPETTEVKMKKPKLFQPYALEGC